MVLGDQLAPGTRAGLVGTQNIRKKNALSRVVRASRLLVWASCPNFLALLRYSQRSQRAGCPLQQAGRPHYPKPIG